MRLAFALEFATIIWNAAEAALALTFGFLAGSLALTAFGIDSVIEVFAAVVVVIELRGHGNHAEEEVGERIFLRLIGASFFLLAIYILIEASWDLLAQARPHQSIPGIVLTSASLATMWFLAVAKHRTGHRINCRPLIADSQETRLCSLLSAVTLAGLTLPSGCSPIRRTGPTSGCGARLRPRRPPSWWSAPSIPRTSGGSSLRSLASPRSATTRA